MTYLSVEPHLVEYGDVIVGLTTPVSSILTDGTFWFYGDASGTFIAKRPSWGRVHVYRETPDDEIDDCPPFGYIRPRAGLFPVPLP